jgi:hypothetical protein
MNEISIQIFGLAQTFHHQLLQITREQLQAVFVRQNHHVFLALAVRREEPHRSQ